MAIGEREVLEALKAVEDPDLGRDIVTLGFVKDVAVKSEGRAGGVHRPTHHPRLPGAGPAGRGSPPSGGKSSRSERGGRPHDVPGDLAREGKPSPLIPKVKNTIAVASGKGGVGKSTVAANLAVALGQSGAQVGLMDTDVYGPSIPLLMGAEEAPRISGKNMVPPVRYGVKLISMAYFLPQRRRRHLARADVA